MAASRKNLSHGLTNVDRTYMVEEHARYYTWLAWFVTVNMIAKIIYFFYKNATIDCNRLTNAEPVTFIIASYSSVKHTK